MERRLAERPQQKLLEQELFVEAQRLMRRTKDALYGSSELREALVKSLLHTEMDHEHYGDSSGIQMSGPIGFKKNGNQYRMDRYFFHPRGENISLEEIDKEGTTTTINILFGRKVVRSDWNGQSVFITETISDTESPEKTKTITFANTKSSVEKIDRFLSEFESSNSNPSSEITSA